LVNQALLGIIAATLIGTATYVVRNFDELQSQQCDARVTAASDRTAAMNDKVDAVLLAIEVKVAELARCEDVRAGYKVDIKRAADFIASGCKAP
jgi:hypothetical protein